MDNLPSKIRELHDRRAAASETAAEVKRQARVLDQERAELLTESRDLSFDIEVERILPGAGATAGAVAVKGGLRTAMYYP